MGKLCGMAWLWRGRGLRRTWRFFAPSFGNRIVPKPARERMAAQKPLQSQPNSPQHAETLDRLVGILRASGIKPAIPREQKRQVRFVKTQCQERNAHVRRNRLWSVLFFLQMNHPAAFISPPARHFAAAVANPWSGMQTALWPRRSSDGLRCPIPRGSLPGGSA